MGRQELAVGAQLPQSSFYEHGYVGAAVVVGAVNLGIVAQGANIVGHVEGNGAHRSVNAEVGAFSLDAGGRLGGLVVLLPSQADGVGELGPRLLVLEYVAEVQLGDADLAEAQLPGPGLDGVGHIHFRVGFARRLDLAGVEGSGHDGAVEPVVLLAVFQHLVGVHRPHPLPVGGQLDVLAFKGILAAVEVHIRLVLVDPRDRFQLLGNVDFNGFVTVVPAGALYLVANLQHAATSPSDMGAGPLRRVTDAFPPW